MCFLLLHIVPLALFKVSGRTCERSTQTIDPGSTILDGGFFGSPQFSTCLVDVPQWCPVIKDLIMNVSVDQALKGLPYLHLTL